MKLSAGSGMVIGAFGAALLALVVQLVTRDTSIWVWAIPIGIAVGLALGAKAGLVKKEKKEDRV